jgi:hypothetical protein
MSDERLLDQISARNSPLVSIGAETDPRIGVQEGPLGL